MEDKKKILEQWLEILTAGGRLNPEKSHALPKQAYYDPANSFEFPSERQRREEAKRVARAKRKRG